MALDLTSSMMEANTFCRKCAVERYVCSIDLHHCQHRDIGFGRFVKQKADAVTRLDTLIDQVSRHLIGAAIQLPVGEDDAIGDDGVIRCKPDAGFLEKVAEPLALLQRTALFVCSRVITCGRPRLRWISSITLRKSGCSCPGVHGSTICEVTDRRLVKLRMSTGWCMACACFLFFICSDESG